MADIILENPIATREISFGEEGKVTIIVGAPFCVDKEMEEFWCHYQILGIGGEKIKRAIGADTMQALFIALYNASTDLYFSKEYREGKLRWGGGRTFADLGLPVSDGMWDDVKEAKSYVDLLHQKQQDRSHNAPESESKLI